MSGSRLTLLDTLAGRSIKNASSHNPHIHTRLHGMLKHYGNGVRAEFNALFLSLLCDLFYVRSNSGIGMRRLAGKCEIKIGRFRFNLSVSLKEQLQTMVFFTH